MAAIPCIAVMAIDFVHSCGCRRSGGYHWVGIALAVVLVEAVVNVFGVAAPDVVAMVGAVVVAVWAVDMAAPDILSCHCCPGGCLNMSAGIAVFRLT